MSQTSLEISSGSPFTYLVTFTWPDNHITRYCRWTSDITVGLDTFISEPSLKVFMDKPQGGDLNDSPVEVQIRTSRSPFDKIASTYPHAKVDVLIEEMAPGDISSRQEVFSGRISKVTVRPSGLGQVAKGKVVGIKARLQGNVGMQALSTCLWALGQGPVGNGACFFDLAGNSITRTISELGVGGVPNRIGVFVTMAPDMSNARWNRGYIQVDGLRIPIRKVVLGSGQYNFDLREIPPPDWNGAAALLVPGCDKLIGTCRIHGQEEHYCAPGIAMPGRNPVFQGA